MRNPDFLLSDMFNTVQLYGSNMKGQLLGQQWVSFREMQKRWHWVNRAKRQVLVQERQGGVQVVHFFKVR